MFVFILGKSPENKPWFLDPRKEEKLIHRIQQQSCRAFRELGLHDFGLFDFRVDVEGNPFLLECNLFCSFGPQSVVNIVAKNSGFTDESLFDMMVENTLLRKRKQENNNVNLWKSQRNDDTNKMKGNVLMQNKSLSFLFRIIFTVSKKGYLSYKDSSFSTV